MKSWGEELESRLGLVWEREDFRAAHIGPFGGEQTVCVAHATDGGWGPRVQPKIRKHLL